MNAQGDVDDRNLERTRSRLTEEVALHLGGSLNLNRTALRLIDLLQPRLADWAVAVVPDMATGELVMLGEAAPEGVVFCRADVEQLPLGWVLQSGHSEHVDATQFGLVPLDPFLRSATATNPAEALGFGLTARGTTFGALIILRRTDDGFSADDVAFAERLTESGALALDAARLYEEGSGSHRCSNAACGHRPSRRSQACGWPRVTDRQPCTLT